MYQLLVWSLYYALPISLDIFVGLMNSTTVCLLSCSNRFCVTALCYWTGPHTEFLCWTDGEQAWWARGPSDGRRLAGGDHGWSAAAVASPARGLWVPCSVWKGRGGMYGPQWQQYGEMVPPLSAHFRNALVCIPGLFCTIMLIQASIGFSWKNLFSCQTWKH